MKRAKSYHILAALLVIRALGFIPAIPLAFYTVAGLDSDRLTVVALFVIPTLLFFLLLLISAWGVFNLRAWAVWTTVAAALFGTIASATAVLPFLTYLLTQLGAPPFAAVVAVNLIGISAVVFVLKSQHTENQT